VIAFRADGAIVVATAVGSGQLDTAIARYSARGGLDGSFGQGGVTTFDLGGDDRPLALRATLQGGLVVAAANAGGSRSRSSARTAA
jgi:hypothetical protein